MIIFIVVFSLVYITCLVIFLYNENDEFKSSGKKSSFSYFIITFLLLCGIFILFYLSVFGTYFFIKLLLKGVQFISI